MHWKAGLVLVMQLDIGGGQFQMLYIAYLTMQMIDLLLFMIIYKYPYLENHIIFSLAAVLEHVITARLR